MPERAKKRAPSSSCDSSSTSSSSSSEDQKKKKKAKLDAIADGMQPKQSKEVYQKTWEDLLEFSNIKNRRPTHQDVLLYMAHLFDIKKLSYKTLSPGTVFFFRSFCVFISLRDEHPPRTTVSNHHAACLLQ
ncbi:hypothetical protein DIPPA_09949 [Diplonema papillatum]|nr:hypothetical protein DIPPA_09949 [Diplonema papillatum]